MNQLTTSIMHERLSQGHDLRLMAHNLGITGKRLQLIENDILSPGLITAMKIAKYLNISVNQLFKLT